MYFKEKWRGAEEKEPPPGRFDSFQIDPGEKRRRRHAFPVRFPERKPLCCKASVPLPQTIPLPSRIGGNAMPGTPVNASMSDGSFTVTRVEPWNTLMLVSHP